MPRRRSQSERRALILAVGSVVFAMVLLLGVSFLAGNDKIDVANLGDREFWVGNADRLAVEIEDRGPFLVPDASPNKRRDLYVQHLGEVDTKGWVAILAGTRDCPLTWNGAAFVTCTGTEYPEDGAGLTRYRTYVEGNAVYVDLRSEFEVGAK